MVVKHSFYDVIGPKDCHFSEAGVDCHVSKAGVGTMLPWLSLQSLGIYQTLQSFN